MDFMTSMKIGASGLTAQRMRMDTIASNLANIETTRTPEGGPYKRKDVIFAARPLDNQFSAALNRELAEQIRQVTVTDVVEDQSPPNLVYNPNHPDANEDGFLALPNINLMEEMVNLINATRSFEANVQSVNAAKAMALRAIDLGR
ncbi:MAG: flagellar basal body rod protein FlgC [Nitrospinaceae bacterium]|nr:flagellar basal body rod protein FlgC [Nitrospinaceae bacterium]NIR57705.1 flagellar basal body rod protein FlgC [Nitrospinaceae bacterium]NIS88169.1 flagellar basal body rod protein FlgC [Nitrospinaceae bacterium]NIT85047.1 flagellar basal body rod protein FlgC [Nitrospinaceae bacterium]NIU47209.1 flagellar basal body rod protein FlgC [Nitrospinaceae bacterium]